MTDTSKYEEHTEEQSYAEERQGFVNGLRDSWKVP